jgi:hypothetical protein
MVDRINLRCLPQSSNFKAHSDELADLLLDILKYLEGDLQARTKEKSEDAD